MRFQDITIVGLSLLFASSTLLGQTKIHFKPPEVNTFLGIRSGKDTVKLAEGVQLIGLPLRIKDKGGKEYRVLNYRFAYHQKGYIQNQENGKIQTVFTLFADRFDQTPLPKVWKENISSSLQKGEDFSFFEILVEDSLGRKFYAPDIYLFID